MEQNRELSTSTVESFFDKELSDITFDIDALDEWKEICGELGMEKQLSLTKGKESPVPYPYMNESMQRVYTMVCPEHVNYKEFNKTPIPMEVLKLISLSVSDRHFQSIEIWYDDKSPDPLVVGLTHKFYTHTKGGWDGRVETDSEEEANKLAHKDAGVYKTDVNHYLVARWGDVKRSFEEIKTMAKERFIEKHASKISADIEILSAKLKKIKENTNLYFMGEISENAATSTDRF